MVSRAALDGPLNLTNIGFSGDVGSTTPRSSAGWLWSFENSSRLGSVVHRISEDVSKNKVQVVRQNRKGKWIPTTDSNLSEFLKQPWKSPGGGGSWNTMAYMAVASTLLLGEFFWGMELGARGVPDQVLPIPGSWVMTTPTARLPRFAITQGFEEIPRLSKPEEVLWCKKPSLLNPYLRGVGRAQCVTDEVTQEELAVKFENSFWRNHARPDIIIFLKSLAKDQGAQERILAQWDKRQRGIWNSWRPALLPDDGRVEVLQSSLKNLVMKEIRTLHRDIIWQAFQVPPEIMGAVENSNRATAEAAMYLYTSNVILPLLEWLYAELNANLVPLFGDDKVRLAFENPVRETEEFLLKETTELWKSGLITRNEARAKRALDPFPAGDPRGEEMILPPNSIVRTETGFILPSPQPNQSEEHSDANTDEKEPPPGAEEPPKDPKPAKKAARSARLDVDAKRRGAGKAAGKKGVGAVRVRRSGAKPAHAADPSTVR